VGLRIDRDEEIVMTDIEWSTVIPGAVGGLVGGLIGGGFAVLGMIVTSRRERRKAREDDLRTIRLTLRDLGVLYETDSDNSGYELTPEGEKKQSQLLAELRSRAVLVHKKKVRTRLELAERCMGNFAIKNFAGDEDYVVTRRMVRYADDTVVALLNRSLWRWRRLPKEPSYLENYRGALELDDEMRTDKQAAREVFLAQRKSDAKPTDPGQQA
jgi:hypothetical protein